MYQSTIQQRPSTDRCRKEWFDFHMNEDSYRYVGKVISKSPTALILTAQHWIPEDEDTLFYKPCSGCSLSQVETLMGIHTPMHHCRFRINRTDTMVIPPADLNKYSLERVHLIDRA